MHAIIGSINYILLFIALYFEVFLLITYFEYGGGQKNVPEVLPSVSVLVPVWNEAETVLATIKSILDLNYPSDKLRVIVIDDGSTDNTWHVVQEYVSHPQVKLLHKDNGGKHTALNYGLEFVDTDMVGCLDADSFVDREALMRIVPHFDNPLVMAVTPSVKVHNPRGVVQLMQKVEYSFGILLRNMLSKLDALYITPGPFSIFRRGVFTELGGYREAHKTEDMEIAMRIQSAGYKIANAPDAFIYTVPPKGIRALYKQRLRWTYGFIRNAFDYRHMFWNPRFGHLGVMILPIASASLLTSLYAFGYNITTRVMDIFNKAVEWNTVGLHWSLPSFDLFFVNTSIMWILGLTTLFGSLVLIMMGRKMADGHARPGLDLIYFLLLYSLIAPFWIGKALYNAILAKETTWR